jgi:hypothetical protein
MKFPTFYGTEKFLTAFTSAHHLALSWARSNQSIPPSPYFQKIHFNIIPSTTVSSKWSHSFRCPHQNPVYTKVLPYTVPLCYTHNGDAST